MEARSETFTIKYVDDRIKWSNETDEPLMKCLFTSQIFTYLLRFQHIIVENQVIMWIMRQKCREFEILINLLSITKEITNEDVLKYKDLVKSIYNLTEHLVSIDTEKSQQNDKCGCCMKKILWKDTLSKET